VNGDEDNTPLDEVIGNETVSKLSVRSRGNCGCTTLEVVFILDLCIRGLIHPKSVGEVRFMDARVFCILSASSGSNFLRPGVGVVVFIRKQQYGTKKGKELVPRQNNTEIQFYAVNLSKSQTHQSEMSTQSR
jgi:hypothetical protein